MTGAVYRIFEQRRAAEERLRRYVEEQVATAPPLTPEQRDRIALALRGGR